LSRSIKTIISLINEIGSEYGAYCDPDISCYNNPFCGFLVKSGRGQPFTIFVSDEDVSELFHESFGEEILDEEIASGLEEYVRESFRKWDEIKFLPHQNFYQL